MLSANWSWIEPSSHLTSQPINFREERESREPRFLNSISAQNWNAVVSLCRESRRVGWAKTKQNKKRKTSSKTRISKLIKFQSALAFSSGPRRDKKKKKEFGFSGFGNRAKCVSRSFQRERYSLKKVFLEQQQKQQNWPFTENVTFQRKRYCSNRMLLFKENVTSQKRTLLPKENVTIQKERYRSKSFPSKINNNIRWWWFVMFVWWSSSRASYRIVSTFAPMPRHRLVCLPVPYSSPARVFTFTWSPGIQASKQARTQKPVFLSLRVQWKTASIPRLASLNPKWIQSTFLNQPNKRTNDRPSIDKLEVFGLVITKKKRIRGYAL